MNTSIKALKKVSNQVARLSHREQLYTTFKLTGKSYTSREIAVVIGLNYNSTSKRISDLKKEGLIVIVDEKEEEGQAVNVYALNRFPELFRKKIKSKFELMEQAIASCVNAETREAIKDEFKRLQTINKSK